MRGLTQTFVVTMAFWLSAGTASAESGPQVVDPSSQSSPFDGQAGKRTKLGYGRLTSNDTIGDGQDRWRTGSVTMSRAYGYEWTGMAPRQFGALIEARYQGQIIAPDNLQRYDPSDRRYAGFWSIGAHTHGTLGRASEYSLGGDLVIVGPQTKLSQFQKEFHKMVGKPEPSDDVLDHQIGNKFRLTVVGEVARSFAVGRSTTIRPFAEARAGDETLLRAGADIRIGRVGLGELLARESVTGQRYRIIYRSDPGFSFVLGADMAYVTDSIYLPSGGPVTLKNRRERARLGLHWNGNEASFFYGLTYLGPEFETQSEGQVIGSMRIRILF